MGGAGADLAKAFQRNAPQAFISSGQQSSAVQEEGQGRRGVNGERWKLLCVGGMAKAGVDVGVGVGISFLHYSF